MIGEHRDLHDRLKSMATKRKGFWCPGCTRWMTRAAGWGVWEDDIGVVHAAYLVCGQCRTSHPGERRMKQLTDKIERRICRLYEKGLLKRKRGILHVTKEML